MDKKILLPTDFSKNALNAIRYTIDLFADDYCEFYLLNAFTIDGFSLENGQLTPELQEQYDEAEAHAKKELQKLLGLIRLHPENPKHSFHTITSGKALLFAAKELILNQQMYLVAMGTKGMTDAGGVLFGTQAVGMMEHITEIPVLTVPPTAIYVPPKVIVFPTDLKTYFKRKELNPLLEIADSHNATIKVVHILEKSHLNKEQKNNKELLQSILQDQEYSFDIITNSKVAQGIHTYVTENKGDLLAIMGRKLSFFKKLLTKPLIQEMGNHSKIPVLTLHDNG
jgi:nucleotide-binding universal stress UspA family protein